ncbi:MAG: 1-acyl-sn-glycerol-3-phosphate acyltransferase [Kiritimatiellae bacterium]|nr:1-acyl-sn-glycerol-3-phosphate acyltransferase [Kiritimatiellia bacterium]
MRSGLAATFFLAFGLGGLVIGCACFPVLAFFPQRRMRALVRASYRLFVGAARATGLFRVDLSPADRARLARTRGRVIVANHLTLIDIVVLIAVLPDSTSIAKAAAKRNFFYSQIVRRIFLANDDPVRALDEAQRLLAQGVNVIVFPEGTRTPADATSRKIRRGAAQIALHAGVPVQPIIIGCDPPVLAKGQPWHDVADRTVVWALRALDEIPVSRPPDGRGTHAAAIALTERIFDTLWP